MEAALENEFFYWVTQHSCNQGPFGTGHPTACIFLATPTFKLPGVNFRHNLAELQFSRDNLLIQMVLNEP